MTIRKDTPPLSILPAHTVILIEQAAARNADPEKVAADLTPCGTQAAQRRHRRAEERCETCRVWGATRQEASA